MVGRWNVTTVTDTGQRLILEMHFEEMKMWCLGLQESRIRDARHVELGKHILVCSAVDDKGNYGFEFWISRVVPYATIGDDAYRVNFEAVLLQIS